MDEILNAVDETPEDSVVPVWLVPLSPEEEDERVKWEIEEAERQAAEEIKLAKRESALAKLEKLGITQEELSALLGQLGTVYQNGSKT